MSISVFFKQLFKDSADGVVFKKKSVLRGQPGGLMLGKSVLLPPPPPEFNSNTKPKGLKNPYIKKERMTEKILLDLKMIKQLLIRLLLIKGEAFLATYKK